MCVDIYSLPKRDNHHTIKHNAPYTLSSKQETKRLWVIIQMHGIEDWGASDKNIHISQSSEHRTHDQEFYGSQNRLTERTCIICHTCSRRQQLQVAAKKRHCDNRVLQSHTELKT